MPPLMALIIWFVLLVALLRYDPGTDRRVSSALWIAVIWMFIVGSRLPSQWLDPSVSVVQQDVEEGNALDRVILSLLILGALFVLVNRSFDWKGFFAENSALTGLLAFALLSIVWSDFPGVAVKRWFRDLGIYLVILVALTDVRRFGAAKMLLRRLCFMLIPLSIILNKYFQEYSRQFDEWTGEGFFSGATTSRNMLGVLCLVSGLYFFWDTFARWRDRRVGRTRRAIAVNAVLFAMTLWLLQSAGSATSTVCLILGCSVIAAAHTPLVKRHPSLLTALIPAGITFYLLLQFVFGIDLIASVARAVGRNPDLTGRTHIWDVVLSADSNPLIGVGYQSFWLGPRLQWVWARTGIHINEAHNGYLEVYLAFGLAGLVLLAWFLIQSYVRIARGLTSSSDWSTLGLALWTILLFYNVTESAFNNGQLLWVVFLMSAITVPQPEDRRYRVPARATASAVRQASSGIQAVER